MKLTICLIWLAGLVATSDGTDSCIHQCLTDTSSAKLLCCEGLQEGNLAFCCEKACLGHGSCA
ncbi:hypothetical protein Plhal304r1_c040g0118721 [Plasmopara halstedii]